MLVMNRFLFDSIYIYIIIIEMGRVEKGGIPKERSTRKYWKECKLGLIQSVKGRYWKLQVTVRTPSNGLNGSIQHLTESSNDR
jgi:hypothetical protein